MKRRTRQKSAAELRQRIRKLEVDATHDRKLLQELDVFREEVRSQNEQLLEVQHLLERSRDRYLDLYDLAPVGYATLDEFGVILELNLPGAEILGRERSRLLGLPFLSCVNPSQRRQFLEHMRHMRTAHVMHSVELEIRRDRNTLRRIELRSRRIVAESHGIHFLVALVDLTEYRKTEQELGASEARLRVAVAAAGAGMWEWDSQRKRLEWSDDHYSLLGQPPGSVKPSFRLWLQCALAADRRQLELSGLKQTRGGGDIDLEYRVPLAGGGVRWLRTVGKTLKKPSGTATKAIGITLDISPLKNIENRLLNLNAILEDRTAEAEGRAAQLRSLIAELARAETQEQARLAEILHDDVQQVLVAADLKIAQIARRGHLSSETESLAKVSEFVRQALRRTSSLSREFNPKILEESGLLQALMWQGTAMKEEYGLVVRVELFTDLEPAEQETRVIVLRSVKELLFNVVKHARTQRARVRVSKLENDDLLVEVVDSGSGFDVREKARSDSKDGQGIPRIRDRILALGGQFRVDSRVGFGTRARLSVPLRRFERSPAPSQRSPIAADGRDPRPNA